ncbi:MAG: hypothetical protein AVDCRST_MAG04-2036, partial [uncultured Acetobacteraceae bacterium]
ERRSPGLGLAPFRHPRRKAPVPPRCPGLGGAGRRGTRMGGAGRRGVRVRRGRRCPLVRL